ncbi:MAG: class I SAM-dependent methyltransferase [Gemmatimonadota bacterium]
MNRKAHWEKVYESQASTEVSWYQPIPSRSLDLIARSGVGPAGEFIDIGGGDSTLVDAFLEHDIGHLTVLDISEAALQHAQARLGPRASTVMWMEADVTRVALPANAYDLWHDRAVFHFIVSDADRGRYVEAMRQSLKPRGHLIMATFASDGPTRCSGLEVARYSPEDLMEVLGTDFELIAHAREVHRTPQGREQPFTYCWCRKR